MARKYLKSTSKEIFICVQIDYAIQFMSLATDAFWYLQLVYKLEFMWMPKSTEINLVIKRVSFV